MNDGPCSLLLHDGGSGSWRRRRILSVVSVPIRPRPAAGRQWAQWVFSCPWTCIAVSEDSALWTGEGTFSTPGHLPLWSACHRSVLCQTLFEGMAAGVCSGPQRTSRFVGREQRRGGSPSAAPHGRRPPVPTTGAGPGPPVNRPWVCRHIIPVVMGLT